MPKDETKAFAKAHSKPYSRRMRWRSVRHQASNSVGDNRRSGPTNRRSGPANRRSNSPGDLVRRTAASPAVEIWLAVCGGAGASGGGAIEGGWIAGGNITNGSHGGAGILGLSCGVGGAGATSGGVCDDPKRGEAMGINAAPLIQEFEVASGVGCLEVLVHMLNVELPLE